jgi:hypothetical protein
MEQAQTVAKVLPAAGKAIEPNSPLSMLGGGSAVTEAQNG